MGQLVVRLVEVDSAKASQTLVYHSPSSMSAPIPAPAQQVRQNGQQGSRATWALSDRGQCEKPQALAQLGSPGPSSPPLPRAQEAELCVSCQREAQPHQGSFYLVRPMGFGLQTPGSGSFAGQGRAWSSLWTEPVDGVVGDSRGADGAPAGWTHGCMNGASPTSHTRHAGSHL